MPGPIQRGRAFVERVLSDGVETVNTEQVEIGGVDSELHWEKIFRKEYSTETIEEDISFPSYFGSEQGEIRLVGSIRESGDFSNMFMRFDKDDGDRYDFERNSGGSLSALQDETEFELCNLVTLEGFAFDYKITNARQMVVYGSSIAHRFVRDGNSRMMTFGTAGITGASELNIFSDGDVEGFVEVFARP